MSSRQPSPSKRRRTDVDDTDQRTSVTSEISISDRTKLRSSASNASRQVSPTRDIFNQLRLAKPAIICEPQASGLIPNTVLSLRKRLTDGFGQKVIPRAFESRIRASDPAGAEDIPDSAYFDSTHMSDTILDAMWSELEEIRLEARYCDMYGKDENAWCLDVVQPILRLSLKDESKLQLTNVQSQQIDGDLLPIVKNNLTRINKKADYSFSYSCRDPEVCEIYQKVSLGGPGYKISHTTDAFTKRTILFSGIEVKADDGGKKEALAQLAIWLSANLERLVRLGELVKGPLNPTDWLFPTVGYTVIGHDWFTYIAYRVGNEVHVIGPISSVLVDTRSTYGILKLCDLERRVKEYAVREYWPWIRKEVLYPLATLGE
ncbi:hypothetical protein BDV37DRAFT_280398 [Aspergillus pseudonomiae]|uniref:PD-(D/E)XK nuclease-like domain-containing protein n=1 Tax=Aspergillus pseudonomiae TaxID=1506151 RepID=A0A5N7DL14_9EURO|nr:uncharacterized protein BDV37DRAFT_280398 [Aspergillus pseudonomiae]KAE8407142.1 hypothetical protein BDV37DRAFT_280398 [Aspergillus pseudonomiae]